MDVRRTEHSRYLILVKHAPPAIDPSRPPGAWPLAPDGPARAMALAESLRTYHPASLVSSEERKARETAAAIAGCLGLAWETAKDLHEHVRDNLPLLEREEFEDRVGRFFAEPDRLVFGRETAGQALDRFAAAVHRELDKRPAGNICLVAHGTVITLFLAQYAGIKEPFAFWRRLGLPSFAVVALPGYELVRVVEQVW